jgi:hypothetical protein
LILTGSALTEVTFSNDQTSLETYFCRWQILISPQISTPARIRMQLKPLACDVICSLDQFMQPLYEGNFKSEKSPECFKLLQPLLCT